MPKEPSKKDQLEKDLSNLEWQLGAQQRLADAEHVNNIIASKQAKIREIEAEITALTKKHEEAPARVAALQASVSRKRSELAGHENRHDTNRLASLAKQVASLSPEEMEKLKKILAGNA